MDNRFHIFKTGDACKTEPLAQARDIDIAIWLVEALGICAPGRYLIVSQVTGNKFYLDADARGTVTMPLQEAMNVQNRHPDSTSRVC